MVFAFGVHETLLELPRTEALALLEWLGLGRPEFGAIEVRVLLPLCRRRLWPEPRNARPLQKTVSMLAERISGKPDRVVQFG